MFQFKKILKISGTIILIGLLLLGGLIVLLRYWTLIPDNFESNQKYYQNIADYLITKNITGIVLYNENDNNYGAGENCICVGKNTCVINGSDIHYYMRELNILDIYCGYDGCRFDKLDTPIGRRVRELRYLYEKGKYKNSSHDEIGKYDSQNEGKTLIKVYNDDWGFYMR